MKMDLDKKLNNLAEIANNTMSSINADFTLEKKILNSAKNKKFGLFSFIKSKKFATLTTIAVSCCLVLFVFFNGALDNKTIVTEKAKIKNLKVSDFALFKTLPASANDSSLSSKSEKVNETN